MTSSNTVRPGRRLTQAEAKALKPGDRVWFYYREPSDDGYSERINEVDEVCAVYPEGAGISLAAGDSTFGVSAKTTPSKPSMMRVGRARASSTR